MNGSVLVPLDGSPQAERAVPVALSLLPEEGTVVVLRVLPTTDPVLFEVDLLPVADAARCAAEGTPESEELARVAARHAAPGVRWLTEVVVGDPAEEILRVAAYAGAGFIAMTTHGRGAFGRALYGSVADRVARSSPVPVLLVRPGDGEAAPGHGRVRRLVVPLDGSALAEAALPVAAALARRLRVPVRLLRAIDPAARLAPAYAPGLPGLSLSPAAYDEVYDGVRADAGGYLEEAASGLQAEGVDATWGVLDGSAFVAIAGAVEAGDLVVLTSHGRGGVGRWLLGSVAEKLVREAPAPVVLVPAAGRSAAAGGGTPD